MRVQESEFREQMESILNDRTSGSSTLVEKILQFVPGIPQRLFPDTVRRILTAHASMAAVINAVNRVCLEKEGYPTISTHQDIDAVLGEFWAENSKHKTWVTLSMSFWVIRCLKRAPADCTFKIGISYPDMEGEETSRQLAEGHRTTLHEDIRLVAEMESSDAVILGADLITEDHVVNKTGSFALSQAAQLHHKPVFVVSSGDKYLIDDLTPFHKMRIEQRGNRFIQFFERIPLELITKIYLTSDPPLVPISDTLHQMAAHL
jgi:translation initiation factor 2B subunit (eIF-2B alpha/beta/delta family)